MTEDDQRLAAELDARAATYRRIAKGMADEAERAQMVSIADGYAAEADALRAFRPRSGRRRARPR
jgi:hypothetical protein